MPQDLHTTREQEAPTSFYTNQEEDSATKQSHVSSGGFDQWRKDRQKEQHSIYWDTNCKRKRENGINGIPRLSSSLTADQVAALSMTMQACGLMPLPLHNSTSNTEAVRLEKATSVADAWEEALRKEQWCINQAIYRRCRREKLDRFITNMEALKQEIENLNGQILQRNKLSAIQTIDDFYKTLGLDAIPQRLPGARRYERIYGHSPALQSILDLQREEFNSVESLKFHWSWYRTQFRVFHLSKLSYERLEAGEHVIIKVTGKLQLSVYFTDRNRGDKGSDYGMIVCLVLQQFEFDGSEQVVTRITSEVDLVGGVAASKDQGGPEYILSALHCLIEGFSISNRDQGCDQAKAKSSAKAPFPSKNLLRSVENSDQLLKTSSMISKHIGQYLNIILQEQRRQGGRSRNSIRTVQLSSSLNVSQVAVLATAIEACGHASSQVQHKRTKTVSVSPASKDLTPDELKARLREQWRINQANYRKRKRKEELQAMREIEVSHQPARKHKEAANLLPLMKTANMITEEWKKARRREQYRLSQARCRERKRKHLQESQATGRMTKKTGL